jgi:hypothetical protein
MATPAILPAAAQARRDTTIGALHLDAVQNLIREHGVPKPEHPAEKQEAVAEPVFGVTEEFARAASINSGAKPRSIATSRGRYAIGA